MMEEINKFNIISFLENFFFNYKYLQHYVRNKISWNNKNIQSFNQFGIILPSKFLLNSIQTPFLIQNVVKIFIQYAFRNNLIFSNPISTFQSNPSQSSRDQSTSATASATALQSSTLRLAKSSHESSIKQAHKTQIERTNELDHLIHNFYAQSRSDPTIDKSFSRFWYRLFASRSSNGRCRASRA